MQENPTLQYSLSLEEVNYILNGLQELPARIANPLSEKIRNQATEQITNIQEAERAEEAEKERLAEELRNAPLEFNE